MKNGLKIANSPLPIFLKSRDTICIKYAGLDFSDLLKTVFMAHAVKNFDSDFNIVIQCHSDMAPWVPKDFSPTPLEEKICFIGEYTVASHDYMVTNHRDIAKTMGIRYPFDVSGFFEKGEEDPDLVSISCSGNPQRDIPPWLEQDLAMHFLNSGKKVNVLSVPRPNFATSHWSKDLIYVSSFDQAKDLIQKSSLVISTDNFFLHLANAFPKKQVVGIFGPTIPESCVIQNSMKVIQIKDENHVPSGVQKSCPCISPKKCHRGYKYGTYPYCLDKINHNDMINRVQNIVKPVYIN